MSITTRAILMTLALSAGCVTSGDTPESLSATDQALYTPPSCGATCQSDGTLAAMNAAAIKYGFPRWFIYATVHRESSFNKSAQNGSGPGNCDIGYGLTQLTCASHDGVVYPEDLSTPNQSNSSWQGDMRISSFCTETGLCPWIDMTNVSALGTASDRFDPTKNLDRYFSGYAAPGYYLEAARAPQAGGESTYDFRNRILRRVAWHWRYGHYTYLAGSCYCGTCAFSYPTDPCGYFTGGDPYRWDTYVGTYRPAVEAEDGTWDGNVCTPPYGSDASKHNFECNRTQGWSYNAGGLVAGVASSSTRAYAGSRSLAVSLSGSASPWGVWTKTGPLPGAGQTVTYRVWIPTGSNLSAISAFVKQGAAGGWTFTSQYKTIAQLTAGAWNTFTVTVPANAATPLDSIGVELSVSSAWTGTVYIDGVTW